MPLKLIKNLRGILIIGEVTTEENNVLTEVVMPLPEVINILEKVNNLRMKTRRLILREYPENQSIHLVYTFVISDTVIAIYLSFFI